MVGNPDPRLVSTSLVERSNLTLRERTKRLTRRTTCFSRKAENHAAAMDLAFLVMNFVMPHHTLTTRRKRPTTPAMEVGLEDEPWTMVDVARRMDADHPIAA